MEGFSASNGRMYFRDRSSSALFSSRDGLRIEITGADLPDDIVPAVNVAGLSENDLTAAPWLGDLTRFTGECMQRSFAAIVSAKQGPLIDVFVSAFLFSADFDGIYDGSQLVAQWKSCCSP